MLFLIQRIRVWPQWLFSTQTVSQLRLRSSLFSELIHLLRASFSFPSPPCFLGARRESTTLPGRTSFGTLPFLKATLKLSWTDLLSAGTNLILGINGCFVYLLLHKITPKFNDFKGNIDILSLPVSFHQILGYLSGGWFSVEVLMCFQLYVGNFQFCAGWDYSHLKSWLELKCLLPGWLIHMPGSLVLAVGLGLQFLSTKCLQYPRCMAARFPTVSDPRGRWKL